MSDPSVERRGAQRARTLAWVGCVSVAAVALMNLLGWVVGWDFVTRPESWVWRLMPGSSAGLVLASAALCARLGAPAPLRRWAAVGLGGSAALVGVGLTVEWSLGGTDLALLWLSGQDAEAPLLVGLMITALGLAPMARIFGGEVGARLAHAIALVAAWLALVSLTSIAYGLRDVAGIVGYGQIGAVAALLTLALALAKIAGDTEHGLTPLMLSDTAGGHIARRLLPAAIAIPLAVGGVRVVAERTGLVTLEYGTAVLANVGVALAVAVVWRTGTSLAAEDTARRTALEALEASEENLTATMNSIVEAVIATDEHCRIVRMNPSAERLTGWTLAEAVGRHIDEIGRIVDAATRQPIPIPVHRALIAGSALLLDGDLLLVARTGVETPVADSAAPIVTSTGRVCGVVLVFRETTAEVQARERLQEAQAQLRQKQKMEAIGRLAGGIAHDFNNLLSIILGYGEIALADLEDGPKRQHLIEILRAGERAADLTRQLLAFSRQQVLQPEVLDVNRVLTELEGLLRRLVSEDVALELQLGGDTLLVEADRGQITQVLLNLCANARDAMPQGGRLVVETSRAQLEANEVSGDERAGDYVRLSVTDTGTGMDEETRDRLFEPFFTTKPQGHGTGLGLATVFGIVEQSHGFVRVHTEPGRGTRFEVYLPTTDKPLVASGAVFGPGPAHESVLLVEDDAQVRAALKALLERLGYRVRSASNGADAVLAFAQEACDVLVTDLVMPQMGGAQLAEELRARRPGLPVVLLSGHARNGLAAALLSTPGTRFLQKPVMGAQLAKALREVLDDA